MLIPPSQWVDLGGPVHFVDFGGPPEAPTLLCVHGLGGSYVNWIALSPLLTDTHRVLALDLPGFGLTRGEGRLTTVGANSRLILEFLDRVVGRPAVLVGNSMGALISAAAAAAHPPAVSGLVMIDPALTPSLRSRPDPLTAAMLAAYVAPGLGTVTLSGRSRIRTAEQIALDTLRLCCVDPSRVSADVVRAHISLAQSRPNYPRLQQEFVAATRSMIGTLARSRRTTAMFRRITAPVLLVHGRRDRLVSIASARAAAARHPSWRFEIAEDAGHVPHLEVPSWTATVMLDWLAAGVGRESGLDLPRNVDQAYREGPGTRDRHRWLAL